LEFEDVGFFWREGGRKTREPGEKPSQRDENQQQIRLNPHMAGIEPRPQWWELASASALTTVPMIPAPHIEPIQ